MEKTYDKYKNLDGFKTEHITVHNHLSDPESWFVTIRSLSVFGKRLCKKTCTEQEIARHINIMLHEELEEVNNLIKQIIPFT